MRAVLHDVSARRTFLPKVHFIYEGEDQSLFGNMANTLFVDVDVQGDVRQVTPTSAAVEISSFYIQAEDGEPILHIQGVFPEMYVHCNTAQTHT